MLHSTLCLLLLLLLLCYCPALLLLLLLLLLPWTCLGTELCAACFVGLLQRGAAGCFLCELPPPDASGVQPAAAAAAVACVCVRKAWHQHTQAFIYVEECHTAGAVHS
jgi:hypothetical protein